MVVVFVVGKGRQGPDSARLWQSPLAVPKKCSALVVILLLVPLLLLLTPIARLVVLLLPLPL